MKATMTELYRGSMAGRTMYVIPFCMGPLDSADSKLGAEITDSEYVVGSMRIMTRVGTDALRKIEQTGEYVQALHSLGAPLAPGQPADLLLFDADAPWRIDADTLPGLSGNTPFDGLPVQGKALRLWKGGREV